MKRIVIFGLICAAFAITARAGFNLPPKSFKIEEWVKALEMANKEGKPLAFLVSDTETDSQKITEASRDIIRRLRADTVLVYSDSYSKLPEDVRKLAQGVKLGSIPYVIVTDGNITKVVGVVLYEDIDRNTARAFRDLEEAIKEYRKLSQKPAAQKPETKPSEAR